MQNIDKLLTVQKNNTWFINRYLLNNQLYPKGPIHPIIAALCLYLNQLKCLQMYTQHTWAEDKISDSHVFPSLLKPSLATRQRRSLYAIEKKYDNYIKTRVGLVKNIHNLKQRAYQFYEINLDSNNFTRYAEKIKQFSSASPLYVMESTKHKDVYLPITQ